MDSRDFKVGDVVIHFKHETTDSKLGYMYKIISFAKHAETGECLVIYTKMYPSKDDIETTFARPYEMFVSEVDHEKYPDIKQKYRFEICRRGE